MDIEYLTQIFSRFKTDHGKAVFNPINQGYLNDTFLVSSIDRPVYILQRINHKVFKNVEGLMGNIDMALEKLQAHDYRQISLLKTSEGKSFLNEGDNFWRLYTFIQGSTTYNTTTDPAVALEAGRIIGKFHTLLKDESPENYEDTIPNFNDLNFRLTEFFEALENSSEKRKQIAVNEIDFAQDTHSRFASFYKAAIPVRVCHNDTKFNNILFDKNNKALCLIDLDTIMIGYFHYDYGDAIRTIVNTANEDESDLTKVEFNKTLFEAFIDGLKPNANFLTAVEKEYLPIATALVPFIHGLRALTDYLNGNIYYKVNYEDQNLNRSKSIFHFTKLALSHQDYLKDHINSALF